MADHKHGEMDITEQTATYNGFIKFTTRSAYVLIGLAVFLAVFAS
jgi:Bacterial aa3 type cytochrome c oxidase subunit IV